MQNLGSKVSQLCRFLEADHLNPASFSNQIRVRRHHAVNVCPNLDSAGGQPGPGDGRGKIAPAAADRGRNPLPSRADEAAHHGHLTLLYQGSHSRAEALVSLVKLRNRASVRVVGDQQVARVHVHRIHAAGLQS